MGETRSSLFLSLQLFDRFSVEIEKMKKLKLLFISCLIFAQVFAAEIPEKREDESEAKPDEISASFKGHSLIEATPMTSDDLEFLRTLDETVPEDVLDFWSTPVKTEEAVPILVHPDLLPHVEEAFQVRFLHF